MQQRDGQDKGAIEPVGHVNMANPALDDRAKEQHRVGNPDQRDQDIDRPFKLCIFLALGPAQWQCNSRSDE